MISFLKCKLIGLLLSLVLSPSGLIARETSRHVLLFSPSSRWHNDIIIYCRWFRTCVIHCFMFKVCHVDLRYFLFVETG